MKKISFVLVCLSLTACNLKKIDPNASSDVVLDSKTVAKSKASTQSTGTTISSQVNEYIQTNKLYHYPEQTMILNVTDVDKAGALITSAGGHVDFDPNLGEGSRMHFLVATLPTEKVADHDFFSQLGVLQAKVTTADSNNLHPIGSVKTELAQDGSRDLFVPLDDMGIPSLRARIPGKGLGENTTIAVIDTGVDASHPAFQDRVIYWQDHTQETRSALSVASVADGKVNLENGPVTLPTSVDSQSAVYVGKFQEDALAAQVKDADRTGKTPGMDLNLNGDTDDTFAVIVAKDKASGLWVAFVDTSGSGTFSDQVLQNPIADFNDIRAVAACGKKATPKLPVFLQFPQRHKTVAYPFIIGRDKDGNPSYVAIGIDTIHHGTHVAGIAAGNWDQIQGAAPQANIMSLKVCSGLNCTDDAIARALVDAFYNPYGCVPDVVNMSLGGTQTLSTLSPVDSLIRDLAAKFGTTFFISAGNSGPGTHTINNIGASGPTVIVGAQVSKNVFQRLYGINANASMQDSSMFFFSSVGPSFTGLLRPNISAPGAALSSIPLTADGSEMMQGTSMASPAAAGSAAAMLSLAKENPELAKVFAERGKKSPAFSLQEIPLAVRASLEASAKRMSNYTDLQQGYGAMDINGAYDSLVQKLKLLDHSPLPYVEFAINDNQGGDGQLLDRSNEIAQNKTITLSLVDDEEADEKDLLRVRNSDLKVSLDYVSVQDNLGHVQELKDNLPFAIIMPGQDKQSGTQTTLVLSNEQANSFVSMRKLEKMESGKTYVAHYSVSLNGERVQTLVDLVQKPFILSDEKKTVEAPGVSLAPIYQSLAFVQKNQPIKINEIHRYPFAVTNRDQNLNVRLGFSPGQEGTLVADVFDAKGNHIGSDTAVIRPDTGRPGLAKKIPAVNVTAPTNGVTGIYEVIVTTTNSGRWANDTNYDLVVSADRVKYSTDPILLSSLANPKIPSKTTVPILNSALQAEAFQVEITNPMELEPLPKMKAVPGKWTFRRIHLPSAPTPDAKTDITVQFAEQSNEEYFGRIDNNLYTISSDGASFEIAYAAETAASPPEDAPQDPADLPIGTGKRIFKGVPLSEDRSLYVALESYEVDPTAKSTDKFDDPNVNMEVLYSGVLPDGADSLDAQVHQDKNNPDLPVIVINAPNALSADLRATIVVSTKEEDEDSPVSSNIPLTVLGGGAGSSASN